MITPKTMVPMESGPHWVWLPVWKGVVGLLLKERFTDETLVRGKGRGAMAP